MPKLTHKLILNKAITGCFSLGNNNAKCAKKLINQSSYTGICIHTTTSCRPASTDARLRQSQPRHQRLFCSSALGWGSTAAAALLCTRSLFILLRHAVMRNVSQCIFIFTYVSLSCKFSLTCTESCSMLSHFRY